MKKAQNSKAPTLVANGYTINHFQKLNAQILCAIEMLGLPEKQEQAAKDKIHSHIWHMWDNPYSTHDVTHLISTLE